MAELCIPKTQSVNRSTLVLLRKFYNTKRSDPYYAELLGKLETLYSNRKAGSPPDRIDIDITYSLSRSKGSSRLSSLGIGRLYGSYGSLEKLPCDLRSTLCYGRYRDIDIENCHPTLLVQLAKRDYEHDMTVYKFYVDNRGAFLDFLDNHYDIAKMDAKASILSMAYGGGLVQDSPDVLVRMKAEADYLIGLLMKDERYAPLLDVLKKDKGKNLKGRFLSFILQTEERKCLLALDDFFTEQGFSADVLAYDGLMIRNDDRLTADVLEEAEAAVKEATGYTIRLKEKPVVSMDLSELEEATEEELDTSEIVPGIPYSKFVEAKTEFEKNHFYFEPQDTVGRCNDDGSLVFFKIKGGHAARACNSHDFDDPKKPHRTLSFVDIWSTVRDRRSITTIDLKPSADPRVFSPPLRFAYQRAEVDDTEAACVEAWRNHTRIICGNDAAAIHYVERWFAHLLQNPFDLPGVGLVITGSKGTGKDVYTSFFMNYVLGESYSCNFSKGDHLFDTHETRRMNKFLVRWQEAQRMNSLWEDWLKAMLTEDKTCFNPKGLAAYEAGNYNRFIITTNTANPVKLSDKERRFVLLTCSAEKQQDTTYFGPFCKLLERPAAGAAVAKYLLSLDLSDFNVRKPPVSEFQAEMVVADKSPEQMFLESDAWDGKPMLACDVYTLYATFCEANHLPFAKTASSMGTKMNVFIRDGLLKREHRRDGSYYRRL